MPDEYISREAALTALQDSDLFNTTERQLRAIRELPAADVAPVVHEKWLLDRWLNWPHRECSRCKIMIPITKEVPDQYWQYCPNCGARMDGGKEEQ